MQCTFCAPERTPCARCASVPPFTPPRHPFLRLHVRTYTRMHIRGTRMSDASWHQERDHVCLCVPVLLCVTRIMRTLASPLL